MNFRSPDELLPCRQVVLDALLGVLDREDRHGALVLGETGMGKTCLLRALERSLPIGRRHVVRATRALSSVRYGALDSLFGSVPRKDLASPVPMLRAARQRLRGHDAGIVLVDDAQFLDEESIHVLTQLAITGVIRLVAFADHSVSPSAGLHGFASEGYLDLMQLDPLQDATLRAMAEHAPGPVPLGPRALLQLREATGGNPMLVRAVLEHSTPGPAEPGDEPSWTVVSERHPPPGALIDLVASVLSPLPDPQRTVLDLLALAGAVPTKDVERLTGSGTVRSLLDQGFIAPCPGGIRYLTLRHGLFGAVIRATLPLGRKTVLYRRLCGQEFILPASGLHRIRRLEWALDAGVSIDAAVLCEAARAATQLGRLELSERFLKAVPAGHGVGTAVEHARLLTARGRPAAAVQLFSGPDPRTALVAQGTVMRSAGAQASDVARLLDSTTRDAMVQATGAAGAGSAPGADCLKARLLLDQGRPDAAELLLGEDAASPPEGRAVALALRGEALSLRGRAVEAAACTQAALDAVMADEYRLGHVYEDVLTAHILVLAHAGAVDQALAALERAETADLPFGPVDALRGIVLIRRGDFRDGVHALVPGLARLRRVDRQLLLPYAVGVAAWGVAALGDAEEAAALLKEQRALLPRGRRDLGILGGAFAAAAATLEPGNPQHPAPLAELLTEALTDVGPHGLRACEKDILVLAVLLGVAGAADRLAELAVNLQGAEARILADFADAAVAGDCAGLGAVADRAAAAGLPLVALNAALRARELHGESRADDDSRSVARRLSTYGAPFVGTRLEASGTHRVSDLTRSESTVARLAAAGKSNRDVAAALCVSVRTVEGHLHRVYTKLGISGRADLVREFGSEVREGLQTEKYIP